MVLFAAVLAVALASCSDKPKVIPARKMKKIYREMFMADQWVLKNPAKKRKADTTWLYEPIFEKYGYTVEDYRYSVDHYLNDPKRYAEMMDKVRISLSKEFGPLNRRLTKAAELRHKADSLANANKIFSADDFIYLLDLTYVNQMTDRISFKKNERGVWYPEPVVEDTVFRGPALIIKDTTSVEALDEMEPKHKLRIWKK